jgi:hypothetical protein
MAKVRQAGIAGRSLVADAYAGKASVEGAKQAFEADAKAGFGCRIADYRHRQDQIAA